MKRTYYYPPNLNSKAKLWFWTLKDVLVIGISLAVSVLMLAKAKLYLPITLTGLYAFLTMRSEDSCIADYLIRCIKYFIFGQQTYYWKDERNLN